MIDVTQGDVLIVITRIDMTRREDVRHGIVITRMVTINTDGIEYLPMQVPGFELSSYGNSQAVYESVD